MTDNEIIKDLEERFKSALDGYYTHLQYGGKGDKNEEEYLEKFGETLDLINRQKEEIKSLKDTLKIYKKYNSVIKHTKAETIKEFADEIEKALENNYEVRRKRMKKYGSEHDEFLSYVDGKIDCLRGLQGFLKEMVGDSDG